MKRESEYSLPFLLLLFFAFGVAIPAALSIAGARECFVERRNAVLGIPLGASSRMFLYKKPLELYADARGLRVKNSGRRYRNVHARQRCILNRPGASVQLLRLPRYPERVLSVLAMLT